MNPSLLWLSSHFFHPSGQADEARAFLRALEAEGCTPAARHANRRHKRSSDVELASRDRDMLYRQLRRRTSVPCVAVHHYWPRPGRHPLAGVQNVARAMFETDRLPGGWAELLENWDAVWVTSRHNYEVFINGGVSPARLRLLGQTIDFDAFRPGLEPYPVGAPEGHFVFLANFDFSERKGWRQLLLAWTKAFHQYDPVCLVLKTGSVARFDAHFVRERILGALRRHTRRSAHAAPVAVIPRMLPAVDVPRLYAAADAYVSASRGEAWGRPYMEAMAMGLPTVGTRYGGNLDFMSDQNSWLVGGTLVAVDDGADLLNELYRGHRWFEADVDELADVMRRIASDPVSARRKAAKARGQLLARFGPGVTARRVVELAREALEMPPERADGGGYRAVA
jgi:glycosyltransferase involved in cell wall biosynthesis